VCYTGAAISQEVQPLPTHQNFRQSPNLHPPKQEQRTARNFPLLPSTVQFAPQIAQRLRIRSSRSAHTRRQLEDHPCLCWGTSAYHSHCSTLGSLLSHARPRADSLREWLPTTRAEKSSLWIITPLLELQWTGGLLRKWRIPLQPSGCL